MALNLFGSLDDPYRQQAMLGLAARLMAAGGPSPLPVGVGQGIGQALAGTLGDVRELQTQAMQKKLRDAQLKEIEEELKERQRIRKIQEQLSEEIATSPDKQGLGSLLLRSGAGLGSPPLMGLGTKLLYGPQTQELLDRLKAIQTQEDRDRLFQEAAIEFRNPAWLAYTSESLKRKRSKELTLPQIANNKEIDAARRRLKQLIQEKKLTPEQIKNIVTSSEGVGIPHPEYDPMMARLVRTATQRKVGADPEFERFHAAIFGGGAQGMLEGESQTITIGGKKYRVIARLPNGKLRIEDPDTGEVHLAERQ